MIIVNFKSITQIFDLPLRDESKIMPKDAEAKKKVREFQKKWGVSSNEVCQCWAPTSERYYNVAYDNIPVEERNEWLENFEIVVRASWVYKFWIWFHKIRDLMNL